MGFSRSAHLALVLAFGVVLSAAAAARQEAGKPAKGKALPGEPCCAITAIDKAEKTITGKVTASGDTFTLKVVDGTLLARLSVGDTLEFKPDTTSSTSNAASAAG